MAIYAIGDVQGCYEPLQQLLEKIKFDPAEDQLWFTGDLVNRGPRSLDVLRFVKSLGDTAITVLGNHDLHLLVVSEEITHQRKLDTLDEILEAPDRDELLRWLRYLPLMHFDERLNICLVHAGIPAHWSIEDAQHFAKEAEEALRADNYRDFFSHMYGNQPSLWSDELSDWERLRYITNAFTRMRYCDAEGNLDMQYKVAPGKQPEGLLPWYEVPDRKNQGTDIVFGHWSTHGDKPIPGIHAIDTGCLWGGQLTALRLDGERYLTQVSCKNGISFS